LLSPAPEIGLGLLETTGLLNAILPELSPCRGCSQKGLHAFDVMDHLFLAAKAARPDLVIRLAALLHDVGKPVARALDEAGVPTFYNHEKISSAMAEKALKRLKFPNEVVSRVLHLIINHMFNYTEDWTDAAVRRFIARVGRDSLDDLFSLRIADTSATQGHAPDPRLIEPFRLRIQSILSMDGAFSVKDLKVGGNELAGIGIPRGPAMGKILNELLETVLDDPDQNEETRLLAIASALKPKFGLQ
ncbi:MAG TPA: HD domain-containing protein, partial [Rectinemataceae bacterium]|nr:HD domain-containing protein [Rectinemataceae bacterium]